MNKTLLAAIALGTLALAGCGRGNKDKLDQISVNETEDLNALSDEAADVAANAQELEKKSERLEKKAQPEDNMGPKTPADENIAGM